MGTGLKALWNLEPCARKRLAPRAEAFTTAFHALMQSINRSLQYAAAHADPEWHKEQVSKRNRLLAVYQTVVREYARQSSSASAIGVKTLQAARALATDVAGHKAEIEGSAAEWQEAGDSPATKLDMSQLV